MRNLTFRIAAVGLILGMSSASVPAMAESPEFEECVANCVEYADGNQTVLNQCINYCFRTYSPEY
ncbi:hypothetical protein AAG602_14900 [Citromicrobium bathyomarinum]